MSRSAEETYDVYDERRVKARKRHKCSSVLCSHPIRPGDTYWRIATVFDGRAETIKRCERCQLLHVHLRDLCYRAGDMWPQENLGCGLSYDDEWGPVPEHIAALAFWSPGDPLPHMNRCTDSPNQYEVCGALMGCLGNARRWNPSTGSCRVPFTIQMAHCQPCTEASC